MPKSSKGLNKNYNSNTDNNSSKVEYSFDGIIMSMTKEEKVRQLIIAHSDDKDEYNYGGVIFFPRILKIEIKTFFRIKKYH